MPEGQEYEEWLKDKEGQEEGAIALSNDAGHMHLLRATGLTELLDDHYPLRLVYLNSCEGARGSEGDPFSGTAASLVRRRIPAVVAMQYQITDNAAIEFCSAFYESLADGLPVDAAITEARVAVSMGSMLEWGTPVLYMRSRGERLFDISTDKRPPPPPSGFADPQETEALERQKFEQQRREQPDIPHPMNRSEVQNRMLWWRRIIGR